MFVLYQKKVAESVHYSAFNNSVSGCVCVSVGVFYVRKYNLFMNQHCTVCVSNKVLCMYVLQQHFCVCVWLMVGCCQDRDGSVVYWDPEVLRLSH